MWTMSIVWPSSSRTLTVWLLSHDMTVSRAPDEAEVAFVVADRYQHHGLASSLLQRLAEAARERGIGTFTAETMAENRDMIDVFMASGFPVTSTCEWGTVTVHFPIRKGEGSGSIRCLTAASVMLEASTVESDMSQGQAQSRVLGAGGSLWVSFASRCSSSASTTPSSTSHCPPSCGTSERVPASCSGSSTPMRSSSPVCCCPSAPWATGSGGSGCSWVG